METLDKQFYFLNCQTKILNFCRNVLGIQRDSKERELYHFFLDKSVRYLGSWNESWKKLRLYEGMSTKSAHEMFVSLSQKLLAKDCLDDELRLYLEKFSEKLAKASKITQINDLFCARNFIDSVIYKQLIDSFSITGRSDCHAYLASYIVTLVENLVEGDYEIIPISFAYHSTRFLLKREQGRLCLFFFDSAYPDCAVEEFFLSEEKISSRLLWESLFKKSVTTQSVADFRSFLSDHLGVSKKMLRTELSSSPKQLSGTCSVAGIFLLLRYLLVNTYSDKAYGLQMYKVLRAKLGENFQLEDKGTCHSLALRVQKQRSRHIRHYEASKEPKLQKELLETYQAIFKNLALTCPHFEEKKPLESFEKFYQKLLKATLEKRELPPLTFLAERLKLYKLFCDEASYHLSSLKGQERQEFYDSLLAMPYIWDKEALNKVYLEKSK